MFFEGAEKKFEMSFSPNIGDLRQKSDLFFKNLVNKADASILSKISNETCTAYLLSESSLFVWHSRILMLTCGQTTLVNSIEYLKESFSNKDITSLVFQRKNELNSFDQKTSFNCDLKFLNKIFDGSAFRFGKNHGHHNLLYHINNNFIASKDDQTIEFLMYELDSSVSTILMKSKSENEIRDFLQLDTYFSEFVKNDYMFEPFGYSLNAISGEDYLTIHMTPQIDSSYISIETSLSLIDQPNILKHFLEILKPSSFDLMTFNINLKDNFLQNLYQKRTHYYESLSIGYDVNFAHYYKQEKNKLQAYKI